MSTENTKKVTNVQLFYVFMKRERRLYPFSTFAPMCFWVHPHITQDMSWLYIKHQSASLCHSVLSRVTCQPPATDIPSTLLHRTKHLYVQDTVHNTLASLSHGIKNHLQ